VRKGGISKAQTNKQRSWGNAAHDDAHKRLLGDVSIGVLVDLYDLLGCGADGDEHPSGGGELLDEGVGKRRSGGANVDG
jgi:hypothetical protein